MRRALVALLFLGLVGCSQSPETRGENEDVPLAISGLGEISESELRNAARRDLETFREKGRKADLYDAAYSMEARLREMGYPEAAVEPILPEGDGALTPRFTVKSGPEVVMADGDVELRVTGEGAAEIQALTDPKAKLERFFRFPKRGLLGNAPPLYRKSEVEAAVTQVETELLLRGYYDAQSELVEPRITNGVAHPLISVVTGRLYTMRYRAPSGDLPNDVRTVVPDPKNIDGKPFHVRLPAEIAARFRKDILDLGYQLSRVAPIVRVDPATATAEVGLDVEVGPRLVMGELRIEGEERTSEAFLAQRFGIPKGTVLFQEELDRATDELYASGLFSRVRTALVPHEEQTDPRVADVTLEVEEVEARSVDFLAGFGSYELLRGAVRYRDRNLFGVGRTFDAELKASLKNLGFEVGIEDPYTLGRDNTLVAKAGVEYRKEPSFETQGVNALLSVRHRIDEQNSLLGGYQFAYTSVSNVTAELPDGETEGAATRAGLFLVYRHDSRDDLLHPWSGFLGSANVFWSTDALLADLNFVEFGASLAHYATLASQVADGTDARNVDGEEAITVLATGFRVLTREILDDAPNLPIQERLFLGGESSVRSFQESELGPFDADGEPLGGLTLWEAHVELRQRIVSDLWGALFYDVGIVNVDSFDFSGPLGHALGVGLRYDLGIGPARLDFAINPGRRFAAEDAWALHFSFGFSF